MPGDPLPPESARQQGRRMACEGILRAQFGRRSSRAASQAMAQLVQAEAGTQSVVVASAEFWRRHSTATALSIRASFALLAGLSLWFVGPTMVEPMLAEFRGRGISREPRAEM